MRKNTIIIIVFVLAALSLAYLLVRTKPAPATRENKPPTIVDLPPISPYQPGAPTDVTFELAPGATITTPGTMNIASVTPSQPLGIAEKIVAQFSSAPKKTFIPTKDGVTTLWAWESGSAGLSVPNDAVATFYFSDISTSGTGMRLVDLGRSLGLPPSITIAPVGISEVAPNEATFPYNQSFGVATKSLYALFYQGSPVLLGMPIESSIVLITDAANRIRYATIIMPISGISLIKEVPIIQSKDILINLNAGRGSFVGTHIESTSESERQIWFSAVTIQTLKTAYLLDVSQNTLLPVYLLDGVGRSASESSSVRYLLRASTQ